MMAKAGMLSPEAAQNHPDRNCLVSALMGGEIAKIDCPEKPEQLQTGDILLCGSDGMQVLPDAQIERLLNKYRRKRASEIAENLLDEVLKADDPQQDNVSFCVIKINDAKASPREDRALLRRRATQQVELLTRLAEEPGTAA